MKTTLFKNTLHHSPNSFIKESGIYVTAISHYRHISDDVPFYRYYCPGYQLFYTVRGMGWLYYKGAYQTIEAGTITCIHLDKRHGMGAVANHTWEHYWLNCSGKLFDYLYNIIFSGTNILKPSDTERVHLIFKMLYEAKATNDLYFDIKVLNSLLGVFVEFLPSGLYNPWNDMEITFIDRVIDFIHQNYYRRIFKEWEEVTPGSYRRNPGL